MSKPWPSVNLREVLTHYQEYINAPEGKIYPKLSVRLYGKGVTLDAPVDGSSLRMKRHQLAKAGQVILSEIWGKKGAIGFVPTEGEGALCTSHFFLFDVRTNKLDPNWLQAIFQANYLQEQLGTEAKGTTGYAAVRPKTLLACEIPLPPLLEQRRIVARIEGLATKIREGRNLRCEASDEFNALQLHIARDLFPEPSGGMVSNWIKFQTGYAFKSEWFSDSGLRLVRNANVGHGTLDWSETVHLPQSHSAEFTRFELREGDILIALDRPIISTGVKVARVRKEDLPCLLLQRVARAQFKSNEVLPHYFFSWLRSPHFINAIDPGRSNGVPHISHKDVERIPFAVPPLPEQHRIVAELDALDAEAQSLKRLQAETAVELDALLPSVLSKAFAGEL
jgi:type I restriction enzyme S subunit